MDTMHPIVFARFKRWMAALANRDPKKKERDLLQARIVEQIVDQHLPQLRKVDIGPALAPPTEAMLAAAPVSTGVE